MAAHLAANTADHHVGELGIGGIRLIQCNLDGLRGFDNLFLTPHCDFAELNYRLQGGIGCVGPVAAETVVGRTTSRLRQKNPARLVKVEIFMATLPE